MCVCALGSRGWSDGVRECVTEDEESMVDRDGNFKSRLNFKWLSSRPPFQIAVCVISPPKAS